MTNPSSEFREKLLGVQEISPALHDAYRQELDAMLRPPLTKRAALIGAVLLILLLGCIVLIARADLIYHVRGLMLAGNIALAAGLLCASFYIVRDLRKLRHSQNSIRSIAGVLTAAAATFTVAALMLGLHSPSDPKSLFSAFYVFVFYFACAVWGLENRIASAELSAREQALRIEYRLADLAERLGRQ
jgi:hypothetical protein